MASLVLHEGSGTLHAAVTLYQRALTIREQIYGPQHPKTYESRENLQAVLHILENEGKKEAPAAIRSFTSICSAR